MPPTVNPPPRPIATLAKLRRRAAEILDRLQPGPGRSADLAADLAARLLMRLDEECQSRLTAGQDEVFGSVARLRPVFAAFLREHATALGYAPAEQDDHALGAELFATFLGRLQGDGSLVFFTDRHRARSRAFESAHYLRHLRQRTGRTERDGLAAARLVEMVKVEVRERDRPDRRVTPAALLAPLDEPEDEWRLPADPDWPADAEVETVREAFTKFLATAFRPRAEFAPFQAAAWRALVEAGLGRTRSKGFVIAAGTGFGKTEAFLLPILFYAAVAQVARHTGCAYREGVDALLLYPRRDLCDNQAERVLGYLFHLNQSLAEAYGDDFPPLRVAVAHSGLSQQGVFRVRCPACAAEGAADDPSAVIEADYPEGQKPRFVCRRRQVDAAHRRAAAILVHQVYKSSERAHLVITTIDTLHRRLMDDHGAERLFRRGRNPLMPVRYVVVDELHIYDGQVGAHAANILRRCRQRLAAMTDGRVPPVIVGASATAGQPTQLAANAFGVRESDVCLLTPAEDEVRRLGLEYYVFVQSPGNRLLLDPGAEETVADGGETATGVVPTRFVSEQATMIQSAMCLQHTMKAPAGPGTRKRRTLGFVDSIDVGQRLAGNLDNADWANLWPPRAGRPYEAIPLYAYRYPLGRPDLNPNGRTELPLATALREAVREAVAVTKPDDTALATVAAGVAFNLPVLGGDCRRAATADCRQPPHHLLEPCARYESGECWFTMGLPGEEGLRPAPIQFHRAGGHRRWGNRFRKPFTDSQRDAWRVLISTSALEVGFDHSELIATWQYHAPPSPAAFVQRKGRGGRGARDYPITLLVLGAAEGDRYCFRNHLRLVDVASSDLAATLDPANPSVRGRHVVAAVFDYLAAESSADAVFYQLDFSTLAAVLTNPPARLTRWLQDCFGMPPADQAGVLGRFATELRRLWNAPIRLPEVGTAMREVLPRDLFLESTSSRDMVVRYLDRVSQALSTGLTERQDELETARAWLEQSYLYHKARAASGSRARFSVVDFCAYVPTALAPDPDVLLPNTTIPVPLGRYVQVYAGAANGSAEPLGQEAAEFALNVFLPGGFRIRYGGSLWMAPWVAGRPSDRPAGPHQAWVNTRAQLHTAPGRGASLVQRFEAADWPERRRREWLDRVGDDAVVEVVTGLNVQEVGEGGGPRSFQLNRHDLVIQPRLPAGANPDDWVALQRDPHITARSFLIARRSEGGQSVPLPNPHPLVRRVRYEPAAALTSVHYANLVHYYPQEDQTRTIVLRFWDERLNRPLCPAVELRSQAVEFRLADLPLGAWDRPAAARAFWLRVESEVLEQLVVRAALLPNAYLTEPLVESLRWLEALTSGSIGGWLEADPAPADLSRAVGELTFHRTAAGLRDPLAFVSAHAAEVCAVVRGAAEWTREQGPAATQARTLAAALARAAGDAMQVSPGVFRRLSEPTSDGWRVLLFDTLDGGSGNARRLAEEIRARPEALLGPTALGGASRCPAAALDRAVAAALGGDHTPDLLAALAADGQFPVEWLPADAATGGRARGHLRRLLETPALAAFNRHAFAVLQRLRSDLGGEPPGSLFVDAVFHSPALDPRAEELRRRFLAADTGVSALPARLRQVTPLCPAGCPECVGDDPETGGDRVLLERLLQTL